MSYKRYKSQRFCLTIWRIAAQEIAAFPARIWKRIVRLAEWLVDGIEHK